MAALINPPRRDLLEYLSDTSESADVRAGSPLPLGTQESGGGVNFAIFSRNASRIRLEFFNQAEDAAPTRFIDFDSARNRTGDVWHVWVKGIAPGQLYAYRVDGPYQTETFVALKLFLDNWRWQDVPFYLRTGKCLPQQASEISIQFHAVPHQSFPPEASLGWLPSRLILAIQPVEGIVLGFQAKYPGPKMQLRPVDMRFSYHESFAAPSPDAYETLLWDVMKKDATLFMRADQVEAAWQLLMPVLEAWQATAPSDFPNYAAGTWGPKEADDMLARRGQSWRKP
jgi:glucose-6-phosphate 1-dehydrogenase